MYMITQHPLISCGDLMNMEIIKYLYPSVSSPKNPLSIIIKYIRPNQ